MIFDDDDDGAPLPPLLPAPQERSTLLDVCVMGVVSGVAVLLTQGAMWLCSPQFGIADLGDFVAHLTPESVSANVYALRWLQGIGTVGMFVVPSLLFAHFFYGLGGYRYLLADKLPRFANVISGAVWFAVAMPLLQFVIWLNEQVPLPAMLQTAAHTTDITVLAMLRMPTSSALYLNIFMMAVLPALGEELWFRGIVQRVFGRLLLNARLGIWLSAVWFSASHWQFDGFLPRLLLGAMLGYLVFWSGSLWTSILVHAGYNALQIVGAYQHQTDLAAHLAQPATFSPLWTVISLLLTPILFFILATINTRNRINYRLRLVNNE